MTPTNLRTRSKRSRVTRAQRVLASLIAGAGVDEIAATERLTPKRTESILRQELRNRWVAPAEDFARLQIARLEQMILKLLERLQSGDLKAIDRALKIVDRLDRYHGFTKAKRIPEQYGDEERARLLKKVNEIVDRLQPEHPLNDGRNGAIRPGAGRQACAHSSRYGRPGQKRLGFSEPRTRHARASHGGDDAARLRAIVP